MHHYPYPIHAVALLLILCANLSTGCLRSAEECQSNKDCFAQEQCIQQECTFTGLTPMADMSTTLEEMVAQVDMSTQVDAMMPDQSATPDMTTGIMCPSGTPLLCGDRCVNPTSDPKACGGCDTMCETGNICDQGMCKRVQDCRTQGCSGLTWCDESDGLCKPGCDKNEQCGDGEVCNMAQRMCVCESTLNRCGGTCVQESPQACGESCQVCPTDPNGSTSCQEGTCQLTCNQGSKLCGGSCATCPSAPGIAQTGCEAKACVITQCAANYKTCAQGCCPNFPIPTGILDTAPDTAGRTSIAIDSLGHIHVLYYIFSSSNPTGLRYIKWDGTAWSTPLNMNSLGSVTTHDIAVDAQNDVHISYIDRDRDDLYYRRQRAGQWGGATVVDSDAGGLTSIAVDDVGNAHISYTDSFISSQKYASISSAGVKNTSTIFNDRVEYKSDIALDSKKMPCVVFAQRNRADRLLYKCKTTQTTWGMNYIIDEGALIYFDPAIAFDSKDTLHIVYNSIAASNNAKLSYATITGLTMSGPETLPLSSNPTILSMAIDAKDQAHILSTRGGIDNEELMHVTKGPNGWTTTKIDDGIGADISADAKGDLYVTHIGNLRDLSTSRVGRLSFTYKENGVWK